ncbi:MAG: S24 family peptidase [Methylobacter sp.]|uniref:LexA family protein n=1 Tax=Methylobacter sp. TaxID=2051955 RepID=UPI0025F6504D|nr:S24 family peptidase [Methylobacter sp.]MCK9622175.1 S24 family peptidase [Methylobacter sp.]
MDIYEIRRLNLIHLIRKKSGGNAASFSTSIGKDPSYVRRCTYENGRAGKKKIGDEILQAIYARYKDLPPGWMDVPQWDKTLNAGNTEPGPSISGDSPLISFIQAGAFCETIDLFNPGDAEEWIPRPKKSGPNTYCLRVKGNSMTSSIPGAKTYPEGTIIFVDPSVAPHSGCRVIAKIPNCEEATFKEYHVVDGKHWLVPINAMFDKIEMTDEMRICGVIIGKWEGE